MILFIYIYTYNTPETVFTHDNKDLHKDVQEMYFAGLKIDSNE